MEDILFIYTIIAYDLANYVGNLVDKLNTFFHFLSYFNMQTIVIFCHSKCHHNATSLHRCAYLMQIGFLYGVLVVGKIWLLGISGH